MAKVSKNYRLSQRTLDALEILKKAFPTWTETEIVETAIQMAAQKQEQQTDRP